MIHGGGHNRRWWFIGEGGCGFFGKGLQDEVKDRPPCPQLNAAGTEKDRPIDALSIEQHAIGALPILDPPLAVFLVHGGMPSTDDAVRDADVAIQMTADGKMPVEAMAGSIGQGDV